MIERTRDRESNEAAAAAEEGEGRKEGRKEGSRESIRTFARKFEVAGRVSEAQLPKQSTRFPLPPDGNREIEIVLFL